MTRGGAQFQPKLRQGGFKDARAPEKVPMRESKRTVGPTYENMQMCKFANYLHIRDISSDPKENAAAVVIFNAH